MSKNQFTVRLSNLHVNDDALYIHRNESSHDPMHKIRSILDHLLTHFTAPFPLMRILPLMKVYVDFREE